MAHHSSERPFGKGLGKEQEEMRKKILQMFENRTAATDMQPGSSAAFKNMLQNLGPTGEYPQGQFGPHDEGSLRFAVGAEDGKIIIDFGTQVYCLGMDPEHAESLAQSPLEKARIARNQRK